LKQEEKRKKKKKTKNGGSRDDRANLMKSRSNRPKKGSQNRIQEEEGKSVRRTFPTKRGDKGGGHFVDKKRKNLYRRRSGGEKTDTEKGKRRGKKDGPQYEKKINS